MKLSMRAVDQIELPVIYTIGHSNHTEETFMALLGRHDITAVVDVRSMPYSRYTPQFNRQILKDRLNELDIVYHFMGKWLGGRSDDPSDYDPDGQVQYDLLSKTAQFQDGLQSVVRGAKDHHIALMCSESRPEDCHRSLLLAEELRNQYQVVDLVHILPDGETQTHEALRNRIAQRDEDVRQPDMFLSSEEKIAIAIDEQIGRIAFKETRFAFAQDNVLRDVDEFDAGAEH